MNYVDSSSCLRALHNIK
uniref:Uncharacterized protein n=1 Tax=Rhizophora mucronata TaxID=61149 RepID=A0A2P2N0F8_RHIMU